MVGLGFRPTDALRSAMTVPAQVLGPEDEIRRIRPGFAADAITVEGDPLANIRVMEDVRFVGVGAFRGLRPRCRSGRLHRENGQRSAVARHPALEGYAPRSEPSRRLGSLPPRPCGPLCRPEVGVPSRPRAFSQSAVRGFAALRAAVPV